jgi:putative sigma-54 modulation protein
MKCNIRYEKIKATDAIKSYVETKMSKLDKYFKDDEITANILIKVKGKKDAIEVTIPCDKHIIRSEEIHDDLYAAIDLVVDKLERQIRKNKTKLKKQTKSNVKFNFDYDLTSEEEQIGKKIVKRKTIEMKPMSEEEALLELELISHDFFIYKDMSNDIKVVYKRKDGNYGSIDIN